MNRLLRSGAAGWAALIILNAGGCRDSVAPPPVADATLPDARPADDEGSCAACHPRQYREWAGSSHNYGQGLDPVYQALELTANYYARHALSSPFFRQSLLCVSCHAPSAGSHIDGTLNPNASFRFGEMESMREIALPESTADDLVPLGRASELQENNAIELAELISQRRITFQGITCDSCHKVGEAFNDLVHEEGGQVCSEENEICARALRAQCEEEEDPRCRRISRGGHHDHEDFFDRGIANFALRYERTGDTRYGPFAEGHVASNIAHGVSSGATEEARNFLVSFPGEAEDRRPYLQSSQFCGACHDVRLPIDNPLTPEVELEPVHEEPFMRLENLYTEWFTSPLNLHPDADPRDNPYLDESGNPRRVVCQDCHMSLYPYAPVGVYPGAYTAAAECDDAGRCGETIAVDELDGRPVTTAQLRVPPRSRVTTHNMTGVDIAMGHLEPDKEALDLPSTPLPASLSLPEQTGDDAKRDPDYNLPMSIDARREQQLKNAVTISLAGTPESVDGDDRDCSDGLCCDEFGDCNLPVKVWLTNINGGHNIAAGFSQERQIWVELTVQDLGKRDAAGRPEVVDCRRGALSDLYDEESLEDGRYPRWTPKAHTALSANDVFDRMYGYDVATGEADHADICRGLSGHLLDKPHDETHEATADGRLDDEDVWLHRIGNTVPALKSGKHLVSWHVVDSGLPEGVHTGTPDSGRVARSDQYHIAGQNAYSCELSGKNPEPALENQPVVVLDPVTGAQSVSTMAAEGGLQWRVTDTPDERLEILYPFPEFPDLLPYIKDGHLHGGDRFGLVYSTNIFYRVCGCPQADGSSCEGPKELMGMKAQMPWLLTYPTLPFDGEGQFRDTRHFPVDRHYYDQALTALGIPGGARAAEAFTFVPINPNHMPNNRSLRFYQPQRHYYDIRFSKQDVVGPIRVSVKAWFRHFPPEFLRLMARTSEQAYQRAEARGEAETLFPHGPLVVEGRMAELFPRAGNVDRVRRILLDEAVTFVDPKPETPSADPRLAVPERPSFAADVQPILENHCLPCHSDVLRHGNLVLDYDAYPEWDDPVAGPATHKAQSAYENLLAGQSIFGGKERFVVPGSPGRSWLWKTLTEETPSDRVRRMPLKTDGLSRRELMTIRRWIESGAGR